ncbi:NGFI-A-binding protein 1-like [Ylistrum balloti]|uniref:NGFI-A-binding protein 1-like n=1 Tax=Ylistrum balloti TaxID=509963 RepID=UPI0029058F39|nr:NGFI-A-binding protein 1-like [Ylistrum balloti]XP_060077822.1 NGFI-A-binding protein 1-like [Ylistrum balloti]
MTSTQPRNSSEWQLYRVLQRANLLPYYDTFIGQGGDDVQQLCEAGEDEFLEIMALVGMASKPLHVRRLQKALQEWVSNPAAFQNPMAVSVGPLLGTSNAVSVTMGGVMTPVRDPQPQQSIIYTSQHSSPVSAAVWTPQLQPAQQQQQPAPPSQPVQQPPPLTPSPQHQVTVVTPVKPQPPPQSSPAPPPISISPGPNPTPTSSSGGSVQGDFKSESFSVPMTSEGTPELSSSTSPVPTPVLVESQINSIAEAAAKLAQELPMFETKRLNMKKLINREIMAVMQMSEDDPNRMEELRKYAAIYGRFDSKRKGEKPMSLHEISVNEASAQLCRHRVSLLTRREDLFPLARQIVKNSGYQYSKGHSRASDVVVPMTSAKRTRFDPLYVKLEKERITNLSQELLLITQRQDDLKAQLQTAKESGGVDSEVYRSLQSELEQTTVRQLQLLSEQNEIVQKHKRLSEEDLQSGSSSPREDNSGDMDEFNLMVRSQLYTTQIPGGLMQDTLFDEGLRIAQQYGMADFAQELKQMHPVEDSSESGEGDGNTNGVKPTENGKSPKNNGDSVSTVDKPKLLPIKLATTNGTDFTVKTEPVDSVEVNGS